MHPVLFELPGGLPVRSFGALLASGFLVAAYGLWPRVLARHGADRRLDPLRAPLVSLAILVGLLLGGRALYCAVEWLRYLKGGALASPVGARLAAAPHEALFLWKGGLVMYGGLAGALLLGTWAARRTGLRLASALDTALPCALVGLAIGRVGCLLIGDDHGSVVQGAAASLPFPVTVRVPHSSWLLEHPESLFPHHLAGQVLWATQTWLSLNALALAALGFWALPRRRYAGQVALWLGLGYACTRALLEFFRGDEVRGLWFADTVSTSQLLSLPLALFCAHGLWRRRGWREDLAPPGSAP
jgi:phosphatidylglycerol:prolipoprotein diacylglycerol transferase